MGASDRRMATSLIYNFFRLGRGVAHLPAGERLILAHFLCSNEPNSFLSELRPAFNEKAEAPISEKIEYLESRHVFCLSDVFPFLEHLSKGINQREFLTSFFIQPDLYIRIHPGKEHEVKTALSNAGISFTEIDTHTLAMQNGSKLNAAFANSDYGGGLTSALPFEVQDLSSQQSGKYFKPNRYEHWWDACAASGGKSLLLFSQEPDIKLVVSDIRESVLDNLDERFIGAGLRTYQKKQLDLTKNPEPVLHDYQFDGIILDAPCSGSGTWGRTPEMISQFEEYKIAGFQNLQKAICRNVVKYLKTDKPLIYITCSVFKEENEEIVNFLTTELGLKLEASELITGYRQKADTMFAARLIK